MSAQVKAPKKNEPDAAVLAARQKQREEAKAVAREQAVLDKTKRDMDRERKELEKERRLLDQERLLEQKRQNEVIN